jgi:hypothetical protein
VIHNLKDRDLLLALSASEASLKVYIVPFLCCESPISASSFHSYGEADYLQKFLPPKIRNFDPENCSYGDKQINEEVADLWVEIQSMMIVNLNLLAITRFGATPVETDNYYVRAVLLIGIAFQARAQRKESQEK